MRLLSLAVAVAFVPATSLAQPQLTTEAMTCKQAQSLVASRGVVALYTAPSTYDRFVASRAGCLGNDTAEPSYVRTRDNPQCALLYANPSAATDLDEGCLELARRPA
jgi:hypothetical protein